MSYIALARKWRPKKFSELVGQTHVSEALSNALAQNRLHHAYLFTGTRGVGKTTIARIFSKALNCELGVTSEPCGVCEACRAVDEGRFVDLIEVDAASRTKVEDTREILENVQYAPTQGRYKVYLIDEVHMLSKSSFNALLKTLEEPPEHVKFLLATTDPHKLPATVLSRCLQFNLMRLTPEQIYQHLVAILQAENIPFESTALRWIAKSAEGSARDSLSLLDQAIAYGAGEVKASLVQSMLGRVDQNYLEEILRALVAQEAQQVKAVMGRLSTEGVDYEALLNALMESLSAISQYQILGTFLQPSEQEAMLKSLANLLAPEQVQMFYQICLLAKQDIQWAPDPRIGFEMALLRLVAFRLPEAGISSPSEPSHVETPKSVSDAVAPSARAMLDTVSKQKAAGLEVSQPIHAPEVATLTPLTPTEPLSQVEQMAARLAQQAQLPSQNSSPEVRLYSPDFSESEVQGRTQVEEALGASTQETSHVALEGFPSGKFEQPATGLVGIQAETRPETPVSSVATYSDAVNAPPQSLQETGIQKRGGEEMNHWLSRLEGTPLEGMGAELARHCEWGGLDEVQRCLRLRLDPNEQTARTELAEQRLLEAVRMRWGADYRLEIVCEPLEGMTPAQWSIQQNQIQKENAKRAFQNDPFVQQFQQYFGAKWIESAIQPRG